MNRVAIYMICKNESQFIERAVQSARTADQIVVCDTGSTDDTLAKLWLYDLYKIRVCPFRFDVARNTALSLVREDIDFCVSLDADEILGDGFIERLQHTEIEAAPGVRINHSFCTAWPDGNVTKHFHERIHARQGFRWVYPIHEKLVTADPVVYWMTDLMIVQCPDMAKSRSSYLPMLQQAVAENGQDWRLWSFLAQERSDRGEFLLAAEALEYAGTCSDADRVFIDWRRAAIAAMQGDLEATERHYLSAAMREPGLRESWFLLAGHYRGRNPTGEAFALARAHTCTGETQGYRRIEAAWSS